MAQPLKKITMLALLGLVAFGSANKGRFLADDGMETVTSMDNDDFGLTPVSTTAASALITDDGTSTTASEAKIAAQARAAAAKASADAAAQQALEKQVAQQAAAKKAAEDYAAKKAEEQARAKALAAQAAQEAAKAQAAQLHESRVAKAQAELKSAELAKAQAELKKLQDAKNAAVAKLQSAQKAASSANKAAGVAAGTEEAEASAADDAERDALAVEIAEAKTKKTGISAIIAKFVERQIKKGEEAQKNRMAAAAKFAGPAQAQFKGMWGRLQQVNTDWSKRIAARIAQKKATWQHTSIAKKLNNNVDEITHSYEVRHDKAQNQMKIETKAQGYNGKPMYTALVRADGTITETLNFGGYPRSFNDLSEEEMEIQREIAFKVVFFFVGFICLCFGLLYAYHRMTQNVTKQEEKQNFFDFLAGQVDDEAVVQTSMYMR